MIRSWVSSSIYFICVWSLVWGGSPVLQASPLFSVTNLGPLGTGAAGIGSLNSSGVAAGFYTDASGYQDAATFNGGRTQLSVNGAAEAINDSGTVVGYVYSGNLPTVTEWVGSQQTSIGLTGYGTAINNAGTIAGAYVNSASQEHAFTLHAGGKVQDLGTLGGSMSAAYAINASGQVAGTSTLANGQSAGFLYDGQKLINLGTLGGTNSYGAAINANGAVAGASQNSSGFLRAFLWTAAGMQDLGTLGGTVSSATGVNDSDWVVGNSLTSNGTAAGFLWMNGVMTNLNSLLPVGSEWDITAADSVNDAGDILATATDDGQTFAIELMPSSLNATAFVVSPEPSAVALAGLGLLFIGKLGRRRKGALQS